MEFHNATPLVAGYAPGLMKNGRRCLVLVAKATYAFPNGEAPVHFAEQQQPLCESDRYTGAPRDPFHPSPAGGADAGDPAGGDAPQS